MSPQNVSNAKRREWGSDSRMNDNLFRLEVRRHAESSLHVVVQLYRARRVNPVTPPCRREDQCPKENSYDLKVLARVV